MANQLRSRELVPAARQANRIVDIGGALDLFTLERDIPPLSGHTQPCDPNPLTHFSSEDTTHDVDDGGALDTAWISPHHLLSNREQEEVSSTFVRRSFSRASKHHGALDACVSVAAVIGLVMVFNDHPVLLGQLLQPLRATPSMVAVVTQPLQRLKARAVPRSFAPLFQPPGTEAPEEEIATIPAQYVTFRGIPSFTTALMVRPSAPALQRPSLLPRTMATVAAMLTAPLSTTMPVSATSVSSSFSLNLPVTNIPPAPATLDASVMAATAPEASDTGAIHDVLSQYRNAFSVLDSGAAQVWPLEFANCEIDVAGAQATALCEGSARYVPKVGDGSPQVTARHWRFNLRKVNQAWRIEDVDSR